MRIKRVLVKVLDNRLRLVIGSIVSDTESSFIKGRQIFDGILVANEVVDEARKCKKEFFFLRWILRKPTTLLIGVT